MNHLVQPSGGTPLGSYLIQELGNPSWNRFSAAIAFVKRSGVRHLWTALRDFSRRGSVEITVGVDLDGTSVEGLEDLLSAVPRAGAIVVFHDEAGRTFHPKCYVFESATRAAIVVGSGNLTGGGLFDNYELASVTELDLARTEDQAILAALKVTLASYRVLTGNLAKPLTTALVAQLQAGGYVKTEAQTRGDIARRRAARTGRTPMFGRTSRPRSRAARVPALATPAAAAFPTAALRGFLMTLQQTDVGRGQTTPGTSQRSPEIFLPVKAVRDYAPSFWGWPALFVQDPQRPNKMDRPNVSVQVGGTVARAAIFRNPIKNDFRLRSEAIRSAASVGDIMRVRRGRRGSGIDYVIDIIPQGSPKFAAALALCINPVPGSNKRWGYYT